MAQVNSRPLEVFIEVDFVLKIDFTVKDDHAPVMNAYSCVYFTRKTSFSNVNDYFKLFNNYFIISSPWGLYKQDILSWKMLENIHNHAIHFAFLKNLLYSLIEL